MSAPVLQADCRKGVSPRLACLLGRQDTHVGRNVEESLAVVPQRFDVAEVLHLGAGPFGRLRRREMLGADVGFAQGQELRHVGDRPALERTRLALVGGGRLDDARQTVGFHLVLGDAGERALVELGEVGVDGGQLRRVAEGGEEVELDQDVELQGIEAGLPVDHLQDIHEGSVLRQMLSGLVHLVSHVCVQMLDGQQALVDDTVFGIEHVVCPAVTPSWRGYGNAVAPGVGDDGRRLIRLVGVDVERRRYEGERVVIAQIADGVADHCIGQGVVAAEAVGRGVQYGLNERLDDLLSLLRGDVVVMGRSVFDKAAFDLRQKGFRALLLGDGAADAVCFAAGVATEELQPFHNCFLIGCEPGFVCEKIIQCLTAVVAHLPFRYLITVGRAAGPEKAGSKGEPVDHAEARVAGAGQGDDVGGQELLQIGRGLC